MRVNTRVVAACVAAMAVACSDENTPSTPIAPDAPKGAVEQLSTAPQAAVGTPAPDADDRILMDSRAKLQSANSLQPALNSVTKDVGGTFAFTSNVDGAGTNALRVDWAGGTGCTSKENRLIAYFPTPRPRSVVVQWKSRLGRSATGGGTGTVDAFKLYSSACSRGGKDVLQLLRDVPDGGAAGRVDYRWDATATSATSSVKYSGGSVPSASSYSPLQGVGRTVTTTVLMQAESAPGAGDGAVKVWIDGQVVADAPKVALGTEAFHRFHLPANFETVPANQSEYLWDIVAWEPKGPVDGGTTTPPASTPVSSVSVSLSASSIAPGATAQATASVLDSAGTALTGRTVTWTSSNAAVATVDANGKVTATGAGTAQITATSENKSGSAALTVTAAPVQVATVTASLAASSVLVGGTSQATATARDASGNVLTGRTVSWSSSNTTIATVSTSGLVTAKAAGSAQITATVDGKAGNAALTVTAPTTPPPSGGTGLIFSDDFESDRSASYFERGNTAAFQRVAGVGRNGSSGMRARWTAGATDAGNLKLAFGRTPTSYMKPADAGTANYREVYWRLYVRNQAGWTGGGADKLSRGIVFANSSWAEAAIGHSWSGGTGSNYLLADPASGTDAAGTLKTTKYNDFANLRWLGAGQSTTPIFSSANVGQWYCVETRMKLNDAGQSNGVFEMWINGAKQVSRTGLNWLGSFNSYGINALFIENYWNAGSPAAQERYIDDLVVSTQPIGCAGTTAPTEPTNPTNPTPVAVATVSASLSASSLDVGGTTQASAVTRDASGNVLTGRTITWSSSNTSVATVSSSGLVTARAAGSAQISATSEGKVGSATVTVLAAATTPPPSGGGSYAALASDKFTQYTSISQLVANTGSGKPYCEFIGSNRFALDAGVTYGGHQTVRIDQPAGTNGISRLTSCFTSKNFWFRIKLKYSNGWTTTGSITSANSFKMFGWWWKEGDGRGDLEITNTTSYELNYNAAYAGSPFVSTGAGTVASEWTDGGWYDYIVHYQVTSSGTRTRFWLSKDGQAPVLRATTNGSGTPTALGIGFPFYFNQTVRSNQSMWIGQWEVVDGAQYASPWGL